MESPEPRIGDTLIDKGRRHRIETFSDDDGTKLSDGRWVCISEFERGGDGVWRRPEDLTLWGAADLERPVGASGPADLAEAARRLRQGSDLGNLLLADVFEAWSRPGRLDLDFLNRTGGPETVRLARHLLNTTDL